MEVKEQIASADIYRLLSACFYQPEAAFLEEDIFGQIKAAMEVVSREQVSLVSQAESSFKEAEQEALTLDYTRLFLGPFKVLAKPYGSVYLDDPNTVMGESTMKVLECYREGGFDVTEDFPEMPDHIAVELEFLYLLTYKIAQAQQDANEQEVARLSNLKQIFLREQLGCWVEKLTSSMRENSETGFYRFLGELTENFVLRDLLSIVGEERAAQLPH